MGIDLVLFDLDDVLVDYSREVRCSVLGERIGRSAQAVHAALFDCGLEREADLGRASAEDVSRTLSGALRTEVTVADCVAARAAAMQPRPALLPVLDALRSRCRLAILTNNGLMVREHFAALCPDYAPYFEGNVHCSALYGTEKPDPEVFLRCADALGVAPGRVLFVDDRPENADGAVRAGMSGHHYLDLTGLHTALAAHRLLETRPHVA